jgi:hypothetical protein
MYARLCTGPLWSGCHRTSSGLVFSAGGWDNPLDPLISLIGSRVNAVHDLLIGDHEVDSPDPGVRGDSAAGLRGRPADDYQRPEPKATRLDWSRLWPVSYNAS